MGGRSAEAKDMIRAEGKGITKLNSKNKSSQLDSYAAAALLGHYFRRSAGEPERVQPG